MSTNWKNITKDLEKQRCIVFLGPKLSSFAKDGSVLLMEEALASYFADYLDQYEIDYDPAARKKFSYISQRFLEVPGVRNQDLRDEVADFIKERMTTVPEVYAQIAELPVQMIINSTPDNFMVQALRQAGKRPIFAHYNFKLNLNSERNDFQTEDDFHRLKSEKPLVYNVFGYVKDEESLIITEHHQLDFITALVSKNPPIPNSILSHFDDLKTYLFLGFDVENWQYRLLIDTFKIKVQKEKIVFAPKIQGFETSKVTRSFFESRFGFHFVEEEIDDFVNTLHTKMFNPDLHFNVYITYAEQDKTLMQGLEKSLFPQVRSELITIWHKDKVLPGEDRDTLIKQNIDQADFVLVIMSIDLLATPSIMDKEIEWVKERQQANPKLMMIPVIGRACDWQRDPDFRNLEYILPKDETPIESGSPRWHTKDDAYLEIVRDFRNLLK